ncbi:hypothetical protein ACFQ9X_25770 [Catenulispora yoronensis]
MTREATGQNEPPTGIDEVALLILEWLGEQGIGAMLRVDALRLAEGRPHWTFAASGGPPKPACAPTPPPPQPACPRPSPRSATWA